MPKIAKMEKGMEIQVSTKETQLKRRLKKKRKTTSKTDQYDG